MWSCTHLSPIAKRCRMCALVRSNALEVITYLAHAEPRSFASYVIVLKTQRTEFPAAILTIKLAISMSLIDLGQFHNCGPANSSAASVFSDLR